MTRELKIAILIGFAVNLFVAILITDHLSPVQSARIADLTTGDDGVDARDPRLPGTYLPSPGVDSEAIAQGRQSESSARGSQRPLYNVSPLSPAIRTDPRPANDRVGSDDPLPRSERKRDDQRRSQPPRSGSASGVLEHVVRPHETLFQISRLHYGDGNLSDELAHYNRDRVGSDFQIRAGMSLQIPPRDTLVQSVGIVNRLPNNASNGTSGGSSAKTAKARTYKIQSGDTLSDIAHEQLGAAKRWREIYELNRDVISDPDVAPEGRTIKLPAR